MLPKASGLDFCEPDYMNLSSLFESWCVLGQVTSLFVEVCSSVK